MTIKPLFIILTLLVLSCSNSNNNKNTSTGNKSTIENAHDNSTMEEVDQGNIILEGSIDSFGSIVLSGTRFETAETELTYDGESSTDFALNDLEVGMIVQLEGNIDVNNVAKAHKVHFNEKVCGPITTADTINNELEISGQVVVFDDLTAFYNIDEEALSVELSVDTLICASGILDDSGHVIATRIRKKDYIDVIKLEGLVKQPDADNKTFYLNNLKISHAKANTGDIESFTEGDHVFVKGASSDLVNDELTATTIIKAPSKKILYDQKHTHHKKRLQGIIVSEVDTTSGFAAFNLRNIKIVTDKKTQYNEDFSVKDLMKGTRLDVYGVINKDKSLLANRINIHQSVKTVLEGELSEFNLENGQLIFDGKTFKLHSSLKMIDKSSDAKRILKDAIRKGDRVKLYAYENKAGEMMIKKLERKDADASDYILRSQFVSLTDTTLEIKGSRSFTINENTVFFNKSSDKVTFEEFSNLVTVEQDVHLAAYKTDNAEEGMQLKWVRVYPKPVRIAHTKPGKKPAIEDATYNKTVPFQLMGHFNQIKKQTDDEMASNMIIVLGKKEMQADPKVEINYIHYNDDKIPAEKVMTLSDFLADKTDDELTTFYGLPMEVYGYIDNGTYRVKKICLFMDKQIINKPIKEKPSKRLPQKPLIQGKNDMDLLGSWSIDKANISFDLKGNYHGTDGCNRLWGQFKAEKGNIKMSRPAMTKKYCPDAQRDFSKALSQVAFYESKDNQLILKNKDKVTVLTLVLDKDQTFTHPEIKPLPSDEKGDLSSKPSKILKGKWRFNDSKAFINFNEKGFDGNDGCNSMRGTFRAGLGKIHFGHVLTTRKACMDKEAQSQSQRVHRVLKGAAYFILETRTGLVLFDAKKKKLAELTQDNK